VYFDHKMGVSGPAEILVSMYHAEGARGSVVG
jgi:hypothetical protein